MATGPYAVQAENLRSVANGSITNSFTALGTPLAHRAVLMKFVNTTDKEMLISDDGTNSKMIVPAGTSSVYDWNANRLANSNIFAYAAGTQFYIKYVAAPSSGNFYIEAFY